MSVVLNCHTWFHVTLILKSPTLYMAWDKTVLLLRDRKKTTLMTKLKHQRQKLNVIIPAVSDSPCLQLLALTHFQKLSSRVYSLSVATFKASPPFVPRTKDQLGALCRFLSFTLHATPIIIDSSSSISHVMPERDGTLSRRKKKVPLLFFLIVDVVFKSKEQPR